MTGLPMHVRELEEWIPHRPPMVWIDEVVTASAAEGVCRVVLRSDALYMRANGVVRPSSMIEWIAQAYAFVRAAQSKLHLISVDLKPKRAFLVAVTNARFEYLTKPEQLTGVKVLHVRVRNERDFGPLSLVDGCVLTEAGEVLATAKIKVFAE